MHSTTTTTATTTTTITFQLHVRLQIQIQLHCGASNHLSVHQWVHSAIHGSQQQTSYSLLSLKLPPPPCAVLLVCGLFVLALCASIAISFGSQMTWGCLKLDGADCFKWRAFEYAELLLHLLRALELKPLTTTCPCRSRDRIILSWACCGLGTIIRCYSGVPGSGFKGSHALLISRWASLSGVSHRRQ